VALVVVLFVVLTTRLPWIFLAHQVVEACRGRREVYDCENTKALQHSPLLLPLPYHYHNAVVQQQYNLFHPSQV